MLRLLAFLLLFILVVPLIRVLIGAAAHALHDWVSGSPKKQRQTPGGKLHRDPVCGVYVSEQVAVRRTADGETLYFCSEECAQKYRRA
jgi:YHS domain-containing protein